MLICAPAHTCRVKFICKMLFLDNLKTEVNQATAVEWLSTTINKVRTWLSCCCKNDFHFHAYGDLEFGVVLFASITGARPAMDLDERSRSDLVVDSRCFQLKNKQMGLRVCA